MDFFFRYQIEMVIGAVSLVALFIAALILDYLLTHNRVVREDSRKEALLKAAKIRAVKQNVAQPHREPTWSLRLILLRANVEKRFHALLERGKVASHEGLKFRAIGRTLVEAFFHNRVERRRS